jgi:hypothetical protein
MPVKFSTKQVEELFAKTSSTGGSKRTPAIFEEDILKLKLGEAIFISAKEWKETSKKDLKTLPIHYRGKFNEKYENNFLEIKKKAVNNEEGFILKRVDPATKVKRPRKNKA